jgi:DNA-nicking Smr family endonuclease
MAIRRFPAGGGRRLLSGEEARLWRGVVSDVRPLTKSSAADPESESGPREETRSPAPPPGEPAPEGDRKAVSARPARPPERPRSEWPQLSMGAAAGVDRRTALRLKRGQLPIEGRIDLHGHNRDQAERALTAFLAASRDADRRCVLVITGKGSREDGSSGVIRASVPRWFNQSPNRVCVLAFVHATPRDGGRGAYYVLLKKKRMRA